MALKLDTRSALGRILILNFRAIMKFAVSVENRFKAIQQQIGGISGGVTEEQLNESLTDVHAQLQTAASNASSALTGLVSRFEEHTVTTTGAAQALATGSQPRLITVEIDSNRDNDIVYMYTPGKPLKELFWL
ncbi:hypothetical protein [Adhaeribacter aquaticus]|uniref:hypothetical protein n=1 Tax=Adhaeribacter aquaticus TaxID=299567 RepID=UPI0003FE3697|nr:hypothetical protein [Adhaeribacter aquaticus]